MAGRGDAGQGGAGRRAGAGRIRNGAGSGFAGIGGTIALTTAGLALGLTSGSGLAQQAETAPPRLTFDLSSSLTHDDNPDLAVAGSAARTRLDTGLGLTLNTATRTQTLSFALHGLARVDADDGFDFRDPSASLSYKLNGADSSLSLTGLYKESPVDLFEPVTPDTETSDILVTTGTITTKTAGFRFETGLQAPIGFDLAGNYSGRSYSQTTDPGVYDTTTTSLRAGVHLRMAGGDTVGLSAGQSATDYDNPTQTARDSRDLSLDYTRALRPDLKLTASLGQSEATTDLLGVEVTKSAGAIGSLGLEASLPNGTASVDLSVNRDSLGTRQALSFGRSLTLRTGTLAASAGVSARSGGQGQVTGALSYTHKLPTDSFGLDLSREVSLNADDQDVANTTLSLNYDHKINATSSFGLEATWLATGSGGSPGVEDASRQTLQATWSHDLTADWQLKAGYQYRGTDKATAGAAQSNAVFLSISRKFTLLP